MHDIHSKVSAATVGTRYFLNSKNVTEAPDKVNRPVPVPSVYRDGRGEIHNLFIGNYRYNILFSRKGVMRSGDLHKDAQHDFVLRGKVRVWTLERDGSSKMTEYGPYQYIYVSPYVPHIFEFLDDTVMAEWWDGPFFSWFYQPFREIVEKSWKSDGLGRLDLYEIKRPGLLQHIQPFELMLTGLAIGIVMGYIIGRQRR